MDWDLYIKSDVTPDYVVNVGAVNILKYTSIQEEFKEKILTIKYVKDSKKKEVNKLLKLMIMAKCREIPC